MPKHTAQSQHLSLPLVLSAEEIALGLKHRWFQIIRDDPRSYNTGEDGARTFWDGRAEERERHLADVIEKDRVERERRLGENGREEQVGQKRKRQEEKPPVIEETQQPPKRPRVSIWRSLIRPFQSLWYRINPPPLPPPLSPAPSPPEPEAGPKPLQSSVHIEKLRHQALQAVPIITSTAPYETEHPNYIVVKYSPPSTDRQRVFEDLHRRGYYISCGAKFGADFLAYATSPMLVHAAIMVVVVKENEKLDGRGVVALGRLGDATRKRTVLAFVDCELNVEYIGVQWEETLP